VALGTQPVVQCVMIDGAVVVVFFSRIYRSSQSAAVCSYDHLANTLGTKSAGAL